MSIPQSCLQFWEKYLATLDEPKRAAARYYDVCAFGVTPENADKAAAAVLRGDKTATSSLFWEYEMRGRQPPEIGALSILLDGRFEPVAVIETTAVLVLAFDEVDEGFVYDYGEGARDLDFWHSTMWGYYEEQCGNLGLVARKNMPLVCEQFVVVFAESEAE